MSQNVTYWNAEGVKMTERPNGQFVCYCAAYHFPHRLHSGRCAVDFTHLFDNEQEARAVGAAFDWLDNPALTAEERNPALAHNHF